MSRPGLLRLVLVASMLGSIALAGCDSSRSTTATSTSVTTTASSPDAAPRDLRNTVFDQMPGNFVEEPVGSNSDGPLDLTGTAEAVDDQETGEQEAILQRFGFVSAYQRTWVVKGTTELLIIRVQVMGSPGQALDYFNLLTLADRTSDQLASVPTPRLTGASAFTRSFVDSDGSQVAQDVNLVRGRLFYHLILTGPAGTISPDQALRVARSQSIEAAVLGYS
jgi:hypothetical protein